MTFPTRLGRRLDWTLTPISVSVLLACLLYSWAHVVATPYPGISLDNQWKVVSVEASIANRERIRLGDVVLTIGELDRQDYVRDWDRVPFDGLSAGNRVPLRVLRDGHPLIVEWQMVGPTPPQVANRILGSLPGTVYWLVGTAVLLLLRPRGARWLALVVFNYLTAFWLSAGIVSSFHVAGSLPVLHVVTWFLVPVYIHLHLLVPTSLFERQQPLILVPLYAVAAALALLDLMEVLDPSAYMMGLLLAILASMCLLAFQGRRQAFPAVRLAKGIMLAGIGLAFGPGILLWVVPELFGQSAVGAISTVVLVLLVPALPLFYTYAIYKHHLGDLEFRANRLLGLYGFLVLYVTVFLLAFWIGGQWVMILESAMVFSLALSAVFVVVAPTLRNRFQHLIDRVAYGVHHEATDVLRLVADRLPSSADQQALTRVLAEDVTPALLIRQSALYLLSDGTVETVYTHGLSAQQAQMEFSQAERLLMISGRQLSSWNRDDAPTQFDWVRLAIRIDVEHKAIGLLLFGRRDPDDYYPQGDIELLSSVAKQVALALENARLYVQSARQVQSLDQLYTSAQQLSGSLDPGELAREIGRACVQTFGARLAWLGEVGADGHLHLLWQLPGDDSGHDGLVQQWQKSPDGAAYVFNPAARDAPWVANNLALAPESPHRQAAQAKGLHSWAAFPLASRDTPLGVLHLYSDQVDFFGDERIGLLQAYAHQAASTLANARLFEDAHARLGHLQALHEIETAISSSLDLRVTLDVLLNHVRSQLRVDAAAVLLATADGRMLEFGAGQGFHTRVLHATRLRLGEGPAGRAALERRMVQVANLAESEGAPVPVPPRGQTARTQLLRNEGFVWYSAMPLIAKGQVQGVLEIFHRASLHPDAEWTRLLNSLACQAAIAIDNASLFGRLQRSNADLELAYDTTLEGWSKALDLRDAATEGHTQRVTETTLLLVRALGLPEVELVHVRRGALLHDIGKMGIPDAILLKPGPLTEQEWVVMRQHPVYAYQMLEPIAFLRPALDIPYCHHEKWDGSGYPRGLAGDHIPLAARAFAAADIWDALNSDRPYRKAWPTEKILEHVRGLSGNQLDPRVVDVFLGVVPKLGTGQG